MATPALPRFDIALPRINATRQVNIDGINRNETILRIQGVLQGAIGWDGGTPAYDGSGRLQTILYTNADDPMQVRVTLSRYASGPSTGRLMEEVIAYSNDAGTTWADVGKRTIVYNAAGRITSANWSYSL